MVRLDLFRSDSVSKEGKVDLNVLDALGPNQVACQAESCLVVHIDGKLPK